MPSTTIDLSAEQQGDVTTTTVRRQFRPVHVFLLFFCVYLITAGGHYTSGDGYYKVQWAKQLVSGGPYWKDAQTSAPHKYGIGHSLLAAPGMLAAKLLAHFGLRTEAVFYTFLFALNGAFLLYLIARYLSEIYDVRGAEKQIPRYARNDNKIKRQVWITTGLIGFATMWWPYTKLDYTEAFVATFFFAAFILLKRGYFVCGFATAGFLLLLRTDSLLLIAILAIWQFWQRPTRRTIFATIAGIVPSLAVFVIVNHLRFGALWDRGYPGESFSNPLLVGLYGILFSAGKSVFLFSPPLILGFVAWKRFRQHLPEDALLFLAVFVCQLLMYSMWWDWSGDDSWGVRFLLTGVVLMTIPCVELVHRRVLLASAFLLGFAVQVPAVLVSGLEYVVIVHSGQLQRQRVGVDGYNVVDIEDVRFNPRYSQIAGNYALLAQRFGQECALDFWWCRLIDQRRVTEPSQ